ncbi:MAG TPA: TonB family protein [Dokdonella sp.]
MRWKRGRRGAWLVLALLAACAGAPSTLRRANRPMPPGSIVGQPSPQWDTPASLLSGDSPVYPVEQFLTGKTGHAEIEFTVMPDGTTRDISVVSANRAVYGRHLAIAASGWRFAPARKDGRAVESRMRVEFEFEIERNFGVPHSPQDDR